MTIEQFVNQTAFWTDKNYGFAIHETDGGALYLLQTDVKNLNLNNKKVPKKRTKKDKILLKSDIFITQIRLDGTDVQALMKHIFGMWHKI